MKHPFSAAIHNLGRCANIWLRRLRSDPLKMHRVVVGSSQSRCRHSWDTGCIRALVLIGLVGNVPERDCFLELSVCTVSVALKPRMIRRCRAATKGSTILIGLSCGGIRLRRSSASTCVSFSSEMNVSAHACAV